MYEMVDLSISMLAQVECTAAIKTIKYNENHNRGYEGYIEGSYSGEHL